MRALMLIGSTLTLVLTACEKSDLPDTGTVVEDDTAGGGDGGDGGDSGDGGTDADQDGYTVEEGDCDDEDASVSPGAEEVCDGVDNDCNGLTDDNASDASTWYLDGDSDGYGDDANAVQQCDEPVGFVASGGDCDDGDAAYHPEAEESCDDPNDYNCDGSVGYEDADGDGHPACEDCDDGDAQVNPDGVEVCDDDDNDCDGLIDDADDSTIGQDTWYSDGDGDGFGDPDSTTEACDAPSGYVDDLQDCDDSDRTISPDAEEVCDDVDNDCDGTVDEPDAADAALWYYDGDGDGYGNTPTLQACEQPSGYVADPGDCDDSTADVNPDATEVCDEQDNDCDGSVDPDTSADVSTWYADDDSDDYGDADDSTESCDQPSGHVSDATDCDDLSSDIYPGADEYCDGIDNDCDSSVDETGAVDVITQYVDSDGDDYGTGTSTIDCDLLSGYAVASGDCDDGDSAVNPDAVEVCDDVDNDCDGDADSDAVDAGTYYADDDGDEQGDATDSQTMCDQPSGYVADDSDCDDTDSATFLGADEVCDGADNDCDSTVDEAAIDASYGYEDDDGDGFGGSDYDLHCAAVDNDWDCDDSDSANPQYVDALAGTLASVGSLDDPWLTIQEGIDAATQCVLVSDGTYYEAIDFGGNDLLVESLGGSGSATINASGQSAPVVTMNSGESSGAELVGFTLEGGSGYESTTSSSSSCGSGETCVDYYVTTCGGGLYLDGATPTLTDIIVQDNTVTADEDTTDGNDTYTYYSYGGGLCALNTTLSLSGVDVLRNDAEEGGGLYIDASSSVTFEQGWVQGNSADNGAGLELDGGTLYLENVAVTDNTATATGGGITAIDGTAYVINATLGNDDAPTGGGLYLSGTAMTLRNSIVYGAATGEGVYSDGTATLSATYNNVYGSAGGDFTGVTDPTGTNGNISSDPLFVDWANGDWSLGAGSPSIDAGNPSSSYDDADGTANDQGAWGGPGADWE